MLKVGGIILSLIWLVLGVSFKLTPDAIDKSLRVAKIISEEGLKLRSYNWSSALVAAPVMGLFEADMAAEECSGKQGIINPGSAWCLEIILTLLTKMVKVYVRFFRIGIQGFSIEWAILLL